MRSIAAFILLAWLAAGAEATSRELLQAKCPMNGCMAVCSRTQGCSACLPNYTRARMPSGIYICVLRGGGSSSGGTPSAPPVLPPSPVPQPNASPPPTANPSPPPPVLLSPPRRSSPPPPVVVASPPPAQQGGGPPNGVAPASGCPDAVDGVDLWGGDLANGILSAVATSAACCTACRSRGAECGGYTFVPALSRCFLKGRSGWDVRPAAGKRSAVMSADGSGGGGGGGSSGPASPSPSPSPVPPVTVTPSPSPSPTPSPSPSSPPPIRSPPPPPKRSPSPPVRSPPPPRASPPPPKASPPPTIVPSPPPTVVGPPGGTTVFTGDATAFSEAVAGTGRDFACAYPWLSQWQSTYFAAINIGQWDGGRQCGRCAMARCVDNRCRVKNKWVQVFLVDQCPTCPGRDLDFSNPAFRELTGLSPDRVKIEWHFTSCANRITGGIRLSPKESSVNEYWQAIFLHNAAEPIQSVTLDGKPLKLETYGFWVNSGFIRNGAPHALTLTSRGGNRLTTTITSLWRAQELPIQFPGGVA